MVIREKEQEVDRAINKIECYQPGRDYKSRSRKEEIEADNNKDREIVKEEIKISIILLRISQTDAKISKIKSNFSLQTDKNKIKCKDTTKWQLIIREDTRNLNTTTQNKSKEDNRQ